MTKYIYTAHKDIEGLSIYRYTKQVYYKLESRERFYVANLPRYGFHFYNLRRKSWVRSNVAYLFEDEYIIPRNKLKQLINNELVVMELQA